jgi:hypothetical protein
MSILARESPLSLIVSNFWQQILELISRIKDIHQGSWFPNFFYYIYNYEMSLEDIFIEFVWLGI